MSAYDAAMGAVTLELERLRHKASEDGLTEGESKQLARLVASYVRLTAMPRETADADAELEQKAHAADVLRLVAKTRREG